MSAPTCVSAPPVAVSAAAAAASAPSPVVQVATTALAGGAATPAGDAPITLVVGEGGTQMVINPEAIIAFNKKRNEMIASFLGTSVPSLNPRAKSVAALSVGSVLTVGDAAKTSIGSFATPESVEKANASIDGSVAKIIPFTPMSVEKIEGFWGTIVGFFTGK